VRDCVEGKMLARVGRRCGGVARGDETGMPNLRSPVAEYQGQGNACGGGRRGRRVVRMIAGCDLERMTIGNQHASSGLLTTQDEKAAEC